jgi:uncharacterized membrane protein YbhN (UPF0104 family)
MQRYLGLVLALFVIGLVLFLARDHLSDLKKIKDFSFLTLAGLSLLFLLMQLILSFIQKIMLAVLNVKISLHELFGLVCIQAFVNFLPLSAGIASTAGYLKIRRGLAIGRYISMAAWLTLIYIVTYSAIALVLLIFFMAYKMEMDFFVLGIFLAVFVAGALVFYLPLPKVKARNRLASFLEKAREGWHEIGRRPAAILQISLLNLVVLALTAARFFIIFHVMGYKIDYTVVILLTAATTIFSLSALLPGNLGLRETVAGVVTKAFNYSFSTGLFAAVIDRIIVSLWILPLGIIYLLVLFRSRKRIPQNMPFVNAPENSAESF